MGSTVLQEVRNTGYALILQSKAKRATKEIQDKYMAYMAGDSLETRSYSM